MGSFSGPVDSQLKLETNGVQYKAGWSCLKVANPRNFAISRLPLHHPRLAFSTQNQALVPPVSEGKQRAAVVCLSGSCHSIGLTPLCGGRMLGLRKSGCETPATRWFLGDARWRIPPKSGVCTYRLEEVGVWVEESGFLPVSATCALGEKQHNFSGA